MRPLPSISRKSPPPLPRGFLPCLVGAMTACALLGLPRLGQSLWEDEVYSVRRWILGEYRVKDDGTVELKKLSWSRTLWNYTTTNHVLQSILSRASHSAWRTLARPTGLQLNEAGGSAAQLFGGHPRRRRDRSACGAFRLGMGGCAGGVARRHPPVAYALCHRSARVWAGLVLLISVSVLLAVSALNNGQWRWWIALAVANFALLYTWPPALFTVLMLQLCIAISLLTEKRFSPGRDILILRWLVSGTVAGVGISRQLFLPCVPELLGYSKGVADFNAPLSFLKNVRTLLLTGSPWNKSGLTTATPRHGVFSRCRGSSAGLSSCHHAGRCFRDAGNLSVVGNRAWSTLDRYGSDFSGNSHIPLCCDSKQGSHGTCTSASCCKVWR